MKEGGRASGTYRARRQSGDRGDFHMNIKDAVDWLQKQIQRDRKLAAKEKARVEKKRAASAERSGADEAPVSSPRTDPTDPTRSLCPEGGALPSAEAGEALPEEEKKEEAGGYQMTAIPIYNVMVLPHSYIYFQTQNFGVWRETRSSRGTIFYF